MGAQRPSPEARLPVVDLPVGGVVERNPFAPLRKRRRAPVKAMQGCKRANEIRRERVPPRAF
jgi:hypothetical protein